MGGVGRTVGGKERAVAREIWGLLAVMGDADGALKMVGSRVVWDSVRGHVGGQRDGRLWMKAVGDGDEGAELVVLLGWRGGGAVAAVVAIGVVDLGVQEGRPMLQWEVVCGRRLDRRGVRVWLSSGCAAAESVEGTTERPGRSGGSKFDVGALCGREEDDGFGRVWLWLVCSGSSEVRSGLADVMCGGRAANGLLRRRSGLGQRLWVW